MSASVFDPRIALPDVESAHNRHTTTPTSTWESSALTVVQAPAVLGEGQTERLGESVMTAPSGPSSPVAEHASHARTHVRALTLALLITTILAGLTLTAVLRPGLLDTGPQTRASLTAASAGMLLINLLLWRAWSVPRVNVDGQRITDLCRLTVTEILGRQLRCLALLLPAAALPAIALWLGYPAAWWAALPAAALAAAGMLWCSLLIGIAARVQIPESKAEAVLGVVMDARTDPAFYENPADVLEEMTWDEALSIYLDSGDAELTAAALAEEGPR